MGAVSIAAASLIARQTGAWILALLAWPLILGWGYSSPPLRLESHGLGELTIALVSPGLVPLIGYALQSGRLDALALVAVVPLVVLAFGTTFAIHFPDAAGDAISGKKTLVVRLGAERAARLAAAVVVAGFSGFGLLPGAGVPLLPAMLPLAAAPLGGWLVIRLLRGDGMRPHFWDALNFWSAGLLMITAGLQGLGFLLA
jgi:1,4-dihydroxy-2-naphthoate octaprenyltransferase